MSPLILIVLDTLVPLAIRARLVSMVQRAAPSARLIVPEDPANALDKAGPADIAAGWQLRDGLVERAPRLRWIHAFTAGVDHFVGLPGVRDGRIALTRTVGAHTALPEHVLALVLAFARRLHVDIRNQVVHRWDRPAGVIITPHVSGVTPRFFDRVGGVFCENLRRHMAGEPLLHVVDVARGY